MTVKFIDVEEVKNLRFPPSLECPRPYMDTIEFGPVELRSIEWVSFRADIESIARDLGQFQIEKKGGICTIIGYRR